MKITIDIPDACVPDCLAAYAIEGQPLTAEELVALLENQLRSAWVTHQLNKAVAAEATKIAATWVEKPVKPVKEKL